METEEEPQKQEEPQGSQEMDIEGLRGPEDTEIKGPEGSDQKVKVEASETVQAVGGSMVSLEPPAKKQKVQYSLGKFFAPQAREYEPVIVEHEKGKVGRPQRLSQLRQ